MIKRFIIHRYINAGLDYGNALSYVVSAGKCIGFDIIRQRFYFWQSLYMKYYKPPNINIWIAAGGYGRDFKKYIGISLVKDEAHFRHIEVRDDSIDKLLKKY